MGVCHESWVKRAKGRFVTRLLGAKLWKNTLHLFYQSCGGRKRDIFFAESTVAPSRQDVEESMRIHLVASFWRQPNHATLLQNMSRFTKPTTSTFDRKGKRKNMQSTNGIGARNMFNSFFLWVFTLITMSSSLLLFFAMSITLSFDSSLLWIVDPWTLRVKLTCSLHITLVQHCFTSRSYTYCDERENTLSRLFRVVFRIGKVTITHPQNVTQTCTD